MRAGAGDGRARRGDLDRDRGRADAGARDGDPGCGPVGPPRAVPDAGQGHGGWEAATPSVPPSASRLPAAGWPTSAAFTVTVTVHGLLGEGDAGQLTRPVSAVPPRPGSGYVRTCGKHALTEQRSTLCALPA